MRGVLRNPQADGGSAQLIQAATSQPSLSVQDSRGVIGLGLCTGVESLALCRRARQGAEEVPDAGRQLGILRDHCTRSTLRQPVFTRASLAMKRNPLRPFLA
jgi:hypothetical protein